MRLFQDELSLVQVGRVVGWHEPALEPEALAGREFMRVS
jgi:hypothetical protein